MIKKVKLPRNILNSIFILLIISLANMLVALVNGDRGSAFSVIQTQLWGSFWLIVAAFIILLITYIYAVVKK